MDSHRSILSTVRWIAIGCAAFALIGGATTSAGWLASSPRLTDWLNSGIAMFLNTAVDSVVTAVALLLLHMRGRWATRISAGLDLEKETICESASSGTLAKVLARLTKVLGGHVLERSGQISTPRGPFVSQDPSKDFLIQSTGQTYQNQPVAGTRWHVLTNNSTDEKVELLNAIPARLGFPKETLFVEKITRGEALLREYI
jgi:hypothetical protein